MKLLCFLLVLVIAAPAQTAKQPAPSGAAAARRNQPAAAAKTVRPDPNLLDGSKLEAEKRPMFGMLSEIEMGENEGGKEDRISPNSGPAGNNGQPPPPGGKTGASAQSGGSAEKVEEGPAAEAEGAEAKKLSTPEGAQAAGGKTGKQQNMQIGDASLQIQTSAPAPDVVGSQPTTTQQYEKKLPSGQQTNNSNQGAEKGKVIPKGL